ncbi:MAG: hypothetical protein WC508_00625 [Patescibacteria group bacterium]
MKNKLLFYRLVLALVMAIAWVALTNNQYAYNHNFPQLFGLQLYPLIAWFLALSTAYFAYTWLGVFFKLKSFSLNFIVACLLYWPILIFAETAGYYWFNIHNLAAASYPGLPICHCLHAPPWMQLGYFLLGPVYLLLGHLLKLDKKFN